MPNHYKIWGSPPVICFNSTLPANLGAGAPSQNMGGSPMVSALARAVRVTTRVVAAVAAAVVVLAVVVLARGPSFSRVPEPRRRTATDAQAARRSARTRGCRPL